MGDWVWTGRTSDSVTLTGTLILSGLHVDNWIPTSNWTPFSAAWVGPAQVGAYCEVRDSAPGDPPGAASVVDVWVLVPNGMDSSLKTVIGSVYYGMNEGGYYVMDGSLPNTIEVPFTLAVTGLKLYKRYTDALKPAARAYVVAARDILGETAWAGDDITATSSAAGLTGVREHLTYEQSRYFYSVGGQVGAKWYGNASFTVGYEARYWGGVRLTCIPDAGLSAYPMAKWCDYADDSSTNNAGAVPYPEGTPYTGFYTVGDASNIDLYQDADYSPHLAANSCWTVYNLGWPAKVTVVLEARDCDTPVAADFDVTGQTGALGSGSHVLYIDPAQNTAIALNHAWIEAQGNLHENDFCAIEGHGKGADDVEGYDCGAWHIRHLPELSVQKPNGADTGATGFPSLWTVGAGSSPGVSIVNDWPSGETRLTIPAGGVANIARTLYSTYDDINASWGATGFAWEGTYKWMKRWPAATSHNPNGNGDDLWNHAEYRWYGLKLANVPAAQSIALRVTAVDLVITDSHELPLANRRDAYEMNVSAVADATATFGPYAAGSSSQRKVATYRDWNATKGRNHCRVLTLTGFANPTGAEVTIVLQDLALGIYNPATGAFGNDLPADFDCSKVKLAFPHCTKLSPFAPLEYQACLLETQGMPGGDTPDHMLTLGYERPGIDTTSNTYDPNAVLDLTRDRGSGGIWGDINASEGWEVTYSSSAYDAAFKGPALTAPHGETYMLDDTYGFGFREEMMLAVSTSLRNLIARPRCGAFGAAGATNVTLKVCKRIHSGAEGCVSLAAAGGTPAARIDVYEKTGDGVDDYRQVCECGADAFGYWYSPKGARHRGGETSDARDATRYNYLIDAVAKGAILPAAFTWPGSPYDVLYKWFEVAIGAAAEGYITTHPLVGQIWRVVEQGGDVRVECLIDGARDAQNRPQLPTLWHQEGPTLLQGGYSRPSISIDDYGHVLVSATRDGNTWYCRATQLDGTQGNWVIVMGDLGVGLIDGTHCTRKGAYYACGYAAGAIWFAEAGYDLNKRPLPGRGGATARQVCEAPSGTRSAISVDDYGHILVQVNLADRMQFWRATDVGSEFGCVSG